MTEMQGEPRILLLNRLRSMLAEKGHNCAEFYKGWDSCRFDQIDGLRVRIEVREERSHAPGSGRFASKKQNGKLRISCSSEERPFMFPQRKDGTHDLDRFLAVVEEELARVKRVSATRDACLATMDRLKNVASPMTLVSKSIKNPDVVSCTFMWSPDVAEQLLPLIAEWEVSAPKRKQEP